MSDDMILAVTATIVTMLVMLIGVVRPLGPPPRWGLLACAGLHLLAWGFILATEFHVEWASRPVRSGVARPLLLAGYTVLMVAALVTRRRRP